MLVHLEQLSFVRDLVSIVPCFEKFSSVVFLDSATNTSDMGRYSYLTADPFVVLRSNGDEVDITNGSDTKQFVGNPWDILEQTIEEYAIETPKGNFPFEGGAIGYWAYDMGRTIEELPSTAVRLYEYPEMFIGLYDWVLVQDHVKRTVTLITTNYNPDITAHKRKDWVLNLIRQTELERSLCQTPPLSDNEVDSNFSNDDYQAAVQKVKAYLEAGDIYQANISQRFNLPFQGDAWLLYLKLRQFNPGAFAAYLKTPDIHLLSSSPELFLAVDDKEVMNRPIKGTHARASNPMEDLQFAEELENSEKDQAENIMIVDLMRSDIGKVCEIGSVEVTALNQIERHPTVWHLVSTVVGRLRSEFASIDLLRYCFPGGSVTGAPKIRAMEIIEEIEPVRRGVYCGSVGYISFSGNMKTNIAIRTMVMEGENICFHSGGGIVTDSDPASEYSETIDKAVGLMRALGLKTW